MVGLPSPSFVRLLASASTILSRDRSSSSRATWTRRRGGSFWPRSVPLSVGTRLQQMVSACWSAAGTGRGVWRAHPSSQTARQSTQHIDYTPRNRAGRRAPRPVHRRGPAGQSTISVLEQDFDSVGLDLTVCANDPVLTLIAHHAHTPIADFNAHRRTATGTR